MPALMLMLPLMTGCTAAIAPVTVASIATLGRDPADVVVSLVSGRDCSILHLGNGTSYCKAVEPAPAPPPYCTRSLGVVDCWDKSNPFGYYQRQVADGPWMLTATQEQNRTARWPDH